MTLNWFPTWNWQFKERIIWHNKTKVPSCTRWHSLDFNYDKIEERKKANKKLQDIDLTGSWELDQVPSFHDYCTYDNPKTRTSKQGNICNKQARGSWFISLTRYSSRKRFSFWIFFSLQTDISYCFFPTTTKKVFLKWCEPAIFLISKIKYFRGRRGTRRSRRWRLIRNFDFLMFWNGYFFRWRRRIRRLIRNVIC